MRLCRGCYDDPGLPHSRGNGCKLGVPIEHPKVCPNCDRPECNDYALARESERLWMLHAHTSGPGRAAIKLEAKAATEKRAAAKEECKSNTHNWREEAIRWRGIAAPVSNKYENLARLAAAASPGPWVAAEESYTLSGCKKSSDFVRTVDGSKFVCETSVGDCDEPLHPDAGYIAAANPAVILGMIQEISRLRDNRTVVQDIDDEVIRDMVVGRK